MRFFAIFETAPALLIDFSQKRKKFLKIRLFNQKRWGAFIGTGYFGYNISFIGRETGKSQCFCPVESEEKLLRGKAEQFTGHLMAVKVHCRVIHSPQDAVRTPFGGDAVQAPNG